MFSVQFVGRIGVFQLLSSFYLDVISLYLFKIFSIKIIRKDSIEIHLFFLYSTCICIYTIQSFEKGELKKYFERIR